MNKLIGFLKANREDIIRPTAVLLAICIIIPTALALTNKITAERIAQLEVKNIEETMSGLISADSFTERTFKTDGEEHTYYTAESGGETLGYVFVTSDKGYGGEVSVMTAVNPDGTVSGVSILDVSNETPGLGQNAAKKDFYLQFSGLKGGIALLKNGASSEENEVDAVTGATITSTAVTRAVNTALNDYEIIKYIESGAEVSEDEK